MKYPVAAALALAATPAASEVLGSSGSGFDLQTAVEVPLTPQQAFAAFGRPAAWWSPAHTYSGRSENLQMSMSPGGCFCETFPGGGGIEHSRVTYADPGKRIVLSGALGPLLYEAVAGAMDVKFDAVPGGTKVTLRYKAAGFAGGQADKLAPLVDQVLAEQMRRYRDFASPEPGQR